MSTIAKEKAAVITYQKEEDARKAFLGRDIPFNQTNLELYLAGEAHKFADDIKKEEEERRAKAELKEARTRLENARKTIQTNLTLRLKILLVLKAELGSEGTRDKIQNALEETKKEIQTVRDASKVADLERFHQKPYDTAIRVQLSEGSKPDLKQLNETFKVFLRSVQEVWRS